MKQITVIGAGMTSGDLTACAQRAIDEADCIFGAPRLLQPYQGKKPCFSGFTPGELEKIPAEYARIAVLMSGDVGFYSGAAGMLKAYPDARVLPGISSVSAFFAKCGRSWERAALCSAHGRDCTPAEPVRRNALTFFLTGGNIPELSRSLTAAGFGALTVTVGENLGTEQEKITKTTVEQLVDGAYAALSVLLVENPAPDTRVRIGIADEEFVRTKVPMTKQAIRAQIAACLQLWQTDTVWDIGCGTGSVTVEMALAVHKGRVYACDVEAEAVSLTEENCRRFHISNVTAQVGQAPECLAELPAPDAVFIGGSKGNVAAIVETVLGRNPRATLVMTAIALESMAQGLSAFQAAGLDVDVQQIFAAAGKPTGSYHLLMGQNPTFLLTGRMPE